MTSVDLLEARWVLPIVPEGTVLENHAVALRGGLIEAVGEAQTLLRRFPDGRRIRLPNHVLMPGLVNAHTHAAMSLLRGFADDVPLQPWLQEHIWPAEQRWMGPEFVRDGSRLAMLEMLRSGTTCFGDMYFFPEVTAEEAREIGMRACLGLLVLDFPSAWADGPDSYIQRGLELRERYAAEERLHTWLAPHAPYTVGDRSLTRLVDIAEEHDLPIQMHVHETAGEVEEETARLGARPLKRLASLGILGPRLTAVHMTQLLSEEIEAVAEAGAHVVHCPQSNLKLASGMAPVAALLEAGVNVALGTDGAASNNNLDLFREMRMASLLAKGLSGNAAALPAARTLTLATLGGAHALGLGALIGSLEPGKAADLIAIDLDRPETQPVYDPISQVVFAAGREQVTDVWVHGRRLVADGRTTTLDYEAVRTTARDWQSRLQRGDGR